MSSCGHCSIPRGLYLFYVLSFVLKTVYMSLHANDFGVVILVVNLNGGNHENCFVVTDRGFGFW